MTHCPIALPAAYEITKVEQRTGGYLIKWLVPGGDPVYVAVAVDAPLLETEVFWTEMLAKVQGYVHDSGLHPWRSERMLLLRKLPTEIINGLAGFTGTCLEGRVREDGSYECG